jgi:succinyldiaminopimelate transaminase
LPDFPWDRIAAAGDLARKHPDGIVDLSIGTPVDDTPKVITAALAAAANAPGYPTAAGLLELRQAWTDWAYRILNAELSTDQVAPSIGSKEIVAWLPIIFGLTAQSVVAIPELAYPTYAVGAMMAHAKFVTYKNVHEIAADTDLIWVNSPSNPTGEVLGVAELKAIIARGREIGAPVVSDECYIELGWDAQPISILDPRVCDGDYSGILAVHSLSKRSNLAGYRSGSVLGDAKLIADIVSLRKHSGMLVPTPIQMATIAALGDDSHVQIQRELYAKRREILHNALVNAGFAVEHSQAGLYLWATKGTTCGETINWLAVRGILAAPGDFYGPSGAKHVRLALTATDERIASAASRLAT